MMPARQAPPATPPAKTSLPQFAAMVMRTRDKNQPAPTPSLFPDQAYLTIDPATGQPTAPVDLALMFAAMKEAGYELGDPYIAKPATMQNYAEWHLKVVYRRVQVTMAFYTAMVQE